VRIYEAQSDGYEASWLAEEVQALKRGGLRLADIGVLYRSNAQSRIIEHALFSNGIPYAYTGACASSSAWKSSTRSRICARGNPDDDGAFLRVANFPARGIGARSLETLQDAAKTGNVSLHQAASDFREKAARRSPRSCASSNRSRPKRRAALARDGPSDAGEERPRRALQGRKRRRRPVENLNELVNAAAAFIKEAGEHDLSAFLAHASLESGENQAAEGTDALQLMTVHSAKGLEFHAVFITGLEEGLFPHEQSVLEEDGWKRNAD